MKKIFLYITVIYATISMASNSVDVKFATNFGVGLEGGTYYHLFGTSDYSKITGHKAIFENKAAFTGSFEVKGFKSFNIKKDLKIKVGAGVSIDITQLHVLNKIEKVIKNEKVTREGENSVSLPHNGGYEVGVNNPFQEEVKKLNGQFGLDGGNEENDTATQTPKLIELSKKPFYTSLTAFGTVEIEKMLKNFSVYFGVDAGLDIVLEKIEEIATYKTKDKKEDSFKYVMERRKSRVRPKVKGYTGINYKGFETEIGLGYPQFVTLGVGYRFNL